MKYCSVTQQLLNVFRRLEEEKKTVNEYLDGVSLGYSEIQLMETVMRHPDANVSEISDLLGITKGAVTQTVYKLSAKGLIKSVKKSQNRQKKYFILTELGYKVLKSRQEKCAETNKKLCSFVAELNNKEAEAVFSFLECVKECIPFCEFPCEFGYDGVPDKENNDETGITECERASCGT